MTAEAHMKKLISPKEIYNKVKKKNATLLAKCILFGQTVVFHKYFMLTYNELFLMN